MGGWIKLHRRLLDKPIWTCSTPEQKVILITILLLANHKEKQWEWKGKQFICRPGQFITSSTSLAKAAGVTRQNVRTALKRFEKYEFLTYESTKTGILINIVNWAIYQDDDKQPNQEANQGVTNDQPRGNQRLTTTKNIKNDKNDKEIIITPPIVPPIGGSDKSAYETEDNNNAISGESLLVETATGEPNEVSHSKTQKRAKKTLSSVQQARFNKFWEVWPYKVSKGQAEITWVKLDPDDDLTEKIVEGVRRAIKNDRRFQPGGYKPHPSTWLNAKGWEDEFSGGEKVGRNSESDRFKDLYQTGGTDT